MPTGDFFLQQVAATSLTPAPNDQDLEPPKLILFTQSDRLVVRD